MVRSSHPGLAGREPKGKGKGKKEAKPEKKMEVGRSRRSVGWGWRHVGGHVAMMRHSPRVRSSFAMVIPRAATHRSYVTSSTPGEARLAPAAAYFAARIGEAPLEVRPVRWGTKEDDLPQGPGGRVLPSKGMFARHRINAGQRVLVEAPLVAAPHFARTDAFQVPTRHATRGYDVPHQHVDAVMQRRTG